MKEHESIKKLFQLYISGKHFSQTGRALFGKWLRAPQDQETKEDQLHQYWETVENKISDNTWHDWNRLQAQLTTPTLQKKTFHIQWMRYAAAIALLVISISGTYWATTLHTLQQPVEMVELFVQHGDTREILLPDSSRIWVNAGSTVLYPANFEKMDSRTVYLTGEASFNVHKDPEKPFIVKTSALNVQALGTVFTVKSYASENYTTATLEQGSIQVSLKEKPDETYILKPSEQLIYSHINHTVQQNKVDLSLYKLMRKGYLIFENVPFKQLATELEKKYGVTFQYNATRYENDLYCVKFAPDETIEDVMEILHQLMDIQYTIKENHIIVK